MANSASQNLQTNIVINASTGNGFSKVGNTLTQLGSLVNGLSQQLISYGTDSVKVYREYEKSLKDAEVALSTTYGRETRELAAVMLQLDEAATDWAATTIFHTNDVANAISEAAHAGWDLEQILTGLPAAMLLAQHGSLDLSEAVNYIVKSTYAAGVGFDNLDHFIDIWTMAADSSATTVGEVGDAMLRMGSTMRFADSEEELLTLIAVMANSGTVGSDAGTMIRNSMMRLVAPTKKANDALAAMGATAEEISEIVGDEGLAEAWESLAEHGFHGLYDENGNMRSVLDVYSEMALILGDIAGGVDKISSSEEAMKIVGSIFPVRSIVGALNLLNAAADGYDGLYERLTSGDVEGFGAYGAATMMDTLNGRIEIFLSKAERLEQVIGGQLKGQVEDFTEFAGEIVDSIAEMDPDEMSAWIKALEGLALAGPGLLAVGGALRVIGLLAIAGGAIALTGAIVALNDLQESNFKDNFGTMAVDTAEIMQYVQGIGAGFREAYEEYGKLREEIAQSAAAYEAASGDLSSKLLTAMLTNKELSKEDKQALYRLADEMYSTLTEAITKSRDADVSYWETLFGDSDDLKSDPALQEILSVTNESFGEATREATALSKELRNALTSGFADGKLSEEEYNNILSLVRSYNDAMSKAAAEAKEEEDAIRMSKLLHKAQTASWDTIDELGSSVAAERDSILAEQEDAYLTRRYRLETRGASEEALTAADNEYQAQKTRTEAAFENIILSMYDSAIRQGEYAESYGQIEQIASLWLRGELNTTTASRAATAGWITDQGLRQALALAVARMGGEEAIMRRISDYETQGETEAANKLRLFFAAEQLANSFYKVDHVKGEAEDFWGNVGDLLSGGGMLVEYSDTQQFLTPEQIGLTLDTARRTSEALEYGGDYGEGYKGLKSYWLTVGQLGGEATADDAARTWRGMSSAAQSEYQKIFSWAAGVYDLERVLADTGYDKERLGTAFASDYAVYQLLYGEAAAHAEAYLKQNIMQVPVEGNFEEFDADIAARDGQTITVYVDEQPVGGSNWRSGDGYSGIGGKFARGGRATEASIFGEGTTPEWAIPEEHSDRTAALLNAARAASGFSWGEILSRFGGLNANANNTAQTIVYSPVIHAADASGVEAALREDKKRFDRWWRDRKLRDAAEVYA